MRMDDAIWRSADRLSEPVPEQLATDLTRRPFQVGLLFHLELQPRREICVVDLFQEDKHQIVPIVLQHPRLDHDELEVTPLGNGKGVRNDEEHFATLLDAQYDI